MFQYKSQPYNQFQSPQVGQTLSVQTQEELDSETYELSGRNYRNFYEIPVEKDKVYLNFQAKKVFITDSMLLQIGSNDFTFFVDAPPIEPTLFTLPNGQIYRCLDEPVGDLRSYTYFYMDKGIGRKIPNYKTLEVMLQKRQLSYANIRPVEVTDCVDIPVGADMPDLTTQWTGELPDAVGYTILSNVATNVQSLQQITNALGSSTATQQQMVQQQLAAQSAAMQASAAAAQADSDAAAAALLTAQAAADAASAAAAAAAAAAEGNDT